MLIKCPKCGFSQPQDQYCAQCGVDIINFKAPPTSTTKKLFKDPILHLSFIVVVAIISAVVLYRHQKNSIQDRVTYLRGNQYPQKVLNQDRTPSETSIDQQGTGQTGSPVAANKPPEDTIPASALPGAPGSNANPSNNTGPLPAPSASLPPAPSGAPLEGKMTSVLAGPSTAKSASLFKVKVTYAEINHRSLESLSEESSKSGQYNNFGDYSAGIILQAQKRLAAINKDMNIQRTDLDPIELGKPLNWTLNYHSSDREPASQDVSYSTFVNLEEVDNQVFKGNLEVVRSQKELSESGVSSIQKSNFPAVFELSQDAAFFMSGLGSRRADGSKSDSEFVVLLQFEKIESRP